MRGSSGFDSLVRRTFEIISDTMKTIFSSTLGRTRAMHVSFSFQMFYMLIGNMYTKGIIMNPNRTFFDCNTNLYSILRETI